MMGFVSLQCKRCLGTGLEDIVVKCTSCKGTGSHMVHTNSIGSYAIYGTNEEDKVWIEVWRKMDESVNGVTEHEDYIQR